MLYWICPECGHECSPAIRECPTCTTAEILSLAQSFQSVPPSPVRPTASEAGKPAISPVQPPLRAPALVAAKSPPAEFGLKAAGLAPTGDITFQASPGRLPKAHEQPVEPAPSRRRSVAFLRWALPGANTSGLALADRTPSSEVRLAPKKAGDEPIHEVNPAPLPPRAGALAFISSKLKLAEASLSSLERAAIRAIQASFQEQPAALLLCAAGEIVNAPAPPAEQWMRLPKIVLTAKEPGNAGLASLTAGPQFPTLAGPCLPLHLRNFTESRNSKQGPAKKRAAAPAWMVSVLVAIALVLGAGSLIQYLTASRDARAASLAPALTQTGETASAAPLPAAEQHPGARFVEVAGVRVVTAPSRKLQLQYIVINHSAGELTGLNIHIAVFAADSPAGAPPLCSVSSIVPSLGANQSKEIRTDLDARLSSASVPDWQSLRTEVLIARQ
jgi:hypothetical protein